MKLLLLSDRSRSFLYLYKDCYIKMIKVKLRLFCASTLLQLGPHFKPSFIASL